MHRQIKASRTVRPSILQPFQVCGRGAGRASRAVWALNPVALPGLQEGPKKSLNGVQAFIPHRQRPSRVEGGLPNTFQRFEGGPSKKPQQTLWKVPSPADLPGLREDPVRTSNPLEGPFSHRPSKFEAPRKNLKPVEGL